MSKNRFVWEAGDIKVVKKGTPSIQERRHPLAPKPFDREKVRKALSKMTPKRPGDGSGAEGLPLTTDLPTGEVTVVQFFKIKP